MAGGSSNQREHPLPVNPVVVTVTPHLCVCQGYLSMLHLKAVAYFSLDQAVMGNWLPANHKPCLTCQPFRRSNPCMRVCR